MRKERRDTVKTRQAEARFQEQGSVLKITDQLSLRTTKERPPGFRKLLLDFSIISKEARQELAGREERGAELGVRVEVGQDKDHTFPEQLGGRIKAGGIYVG